MTQGFDLPPPMMRGGARLHANQAGRLFLEDGPHPTPSQSTAHDRGPLGINAVDPKTVLRKINADLARSDAVGWEPSTASEAEVRLS